MQWIFVIPPSEINCIYMGYVLDGLFMTDYNDIDCHCLCRNATNWSRVYPTAGFYCEHLLEKQTEPTGKRHQLRKKQSPRKLPFLFFHRNWVPSEPVPLSSGLSPSPQRMFTIKACTFIISILNRDNNNNNK